MKAFLIGPSRVGKTTTRRRLTREITHVPPNQTSHSTGIDPPVTVSVLIGEKGWKGLDIGEQFRDLCSFLHQLIIKTKQSTPAEQLHAQQVPKQSQPTVTKTSSSNTTDLPLTQHQLPQQDEVKIEDEVITELSTLVENEDWGKIRGFLDKAGVLDLLHIVDIGGQPEFHEILPFLLHGPALNLIFFKLTEELDEKYMVEYDDADKSKANSYLSDSTIGEIIQRALCTISSLQTSSCHKPRAVLIGTHFQKSREAEFLRKDDTIQDKFNGDWFMEGGILCPVGEKKGKTGFVYFLDNTQESSDIDGLRDLIRNIVEKEFPAEDVAIPHFLLHLFLRMKFEKSPGWCSMENCKELAKKCGIFKHEEVIKALTYLHDKFGTILYYPDLEKLSKRVIVNVKLIMKLPAEMIRTAFLKKDQGMQKTGVVTKKFINTIYSSSELDDGIPTDEILELLQYRYILCKPTSAEQDIYFMPCLLEPDHDIEVKPSDSKLLSDLPYSPLLLIPNEKFNELTGFVPLSFVPLGLFQASVVKFSQNHNWHLSKFGRYRNRISFFYKASLHIEIRSLSSHLEVRILTKPEEVDQ